MNNLFCIAKDAGIIVEYCRIPLNESISIQDSYGDFILIDYSLIGTGLKEKIHLAHEIGHCVKGAFYNAYSSLDVRQKHENRADKWAIEELISREDFHDALEKGYTEIWELAEYFEVTEDFMRKVICWYEHGNLNVNAYF